MEMTRKTTLQMQTLLVCADASFLGITKDVLADLQVPLRMVHTTAAAFSAIQKQEFDAVIVDWREIDDIAGFLCAVQRSKPNHECVLVAIVRDLLDLKQAFAAGVHFLIHKPASAVQIERCLRAAYCATVARRRRHHREPVKILAAVRTRSRHFGEAMVVNISEHGVGLRTFERDIIAGVDVSAAEEINLRFALPDSDEVLEATGTVIWTAAHSCGVRFDYIPDSQRTVLEQWLTQCVERSLTEMCERIRAVCA